MNQEDAVKVAAILITADKGCFHCVSAIVAEAQKMFPEFDWTQLVLSIDPMILDSPEVLFKEVSSKQRLLSS